jgi:cytidyltransferase-like protein
VKLVLAHGCFDILHAGHFEHFRAAREYGDRLVVSITSARWVERAKGPGHPAHTDADRLAMLRDLRTVDEAWLCDAPGGGPAILHWRPQVYVKGVDYAQRGLTNGEMSACARVGARIAYTTTRKRSVAEMVAAFK